MSLIVSGSNPYNEIPNVEIKPVKPVPEEVNIAVPVGGKIQTQDDKEVEDDQVFTKRVKSAVDRTNEKLRVSRTRCEFSYHEDIKRIAIRVIDEDTNKVIREIPPEKTLEAIQKMWELAGILVDERR